MKFPRRFAIALLISTNIYTSPAISQPWIFDASQLRGDVSDEDIAMFNQGGQLPGTYLVEILLNGEPVDYREVVFKKIKNAQGGEVLQPCLSRALLSHYGIKTEDYPALSSKTADEDKSCTDISVIPNARADFNFGSQQVELSVPQIALRSKLKGIAPRELWSEGIPAILMNYRTSATHMESRIGGGVNESQFVQLEPGANWGAWRMRNSTVWNKSRRETGSWQSNYTRFERGLYDMQSRITLGEYVTPSQIFDSVPFRGVMLGSDESMMPDSQRAFSPVIRGIARTPARVEVRRNGDTVYNANVAPGPFALDDLAVGGSGGDLQVTVYEADGSTQVYSVSYQTPAIALQQGHMVYNLMMGQYRTSDNTPMVQATTMYGLPRDMTLYGGLQWSEYFQAATAGLGISLGSWGAMSLDGTRGSGQKKGRGKETGGYGRLRYDKNFEATNTSFSMSTTQYTSSSYSTLPEVMESYRHEISGKYSEKRRTADSLTITQSFGEWGNISLSGSRNKYGSEHGTVDSFIASYGVGIRGVSLSFNAMQNRIRRNSNWQDNRQINVMFSVPLNLWLTGTSQVSYQMASSSGGNTQQLGLSGQSYDRQLRWNINQRKNSGGADTDRNSSDLNLGWSGGYGELSGSYGYSSSWRQAGLDASGGIVITHSGITAGQSLSDAVALVQAPGAAGVSVGGWPGVKTDFRGFTTQSGLQPYRKNIVSLDPTSMPLNAELRQTDVTVVPTQGAIIPATFVTNIGGRALITLTRPSGKSIPFGSVVNVQKQSSAGNGIIGEGGQVYMSGLEEEGTMVARWGEGLHQQCLANYRLPKNKGPAGLFILAVECR